MKQKIFVFGSNLAGYHGAGSARAAVENHGAVMGQGWGLQGNSFAIPTKNKALKTLPIREVEVHCRMFLIFACAAPGMEFDIVAIGCGLAGFKPEEIAPFFKEAPINCNLPKEFLEVLGRK